MSELYQIRINNMIEKLSLKYEGTQPLLIREAALAIQGEDHLTESEYLEARSHIKEKNLELFDGQFEKQIRLEMENYLERVHGIYPKYYLSFEELLCETGLEELHDKIFKTMRQEFPEHNEAFFADIQKYRWHILQFMRNDKNLCQYERFRNLWCRDINKEPIDQYSTKLYMESLKHTLQQMLNDIDDPVKRENSQEVSGKLWQYLQEQQKLQHYQHDGGFFDKAAAALVNVFQSKQTKTSR